MIRPFRPGDLDDLIVVQQAIGDVSWYRKADPEYSFTGLIDGEVVACGGLFPSDGTAEAWVAVDPLSVSQMRWVILEAKRMIPVLMEKGGLRRVQASVPSQFAQALKFARLCGFRYEGPLHRLGLDGSDYERYAIWR